jgi:hypothetical protein
MSVLKEVANARALQRAPDVVIPSLDTALEPLQQALRSNIAKMPPRGKPAAELTDDERLAVCIAAGVPTEATLDGNKLTLRTAVLCAVQDRGDGGYYVVSQGSVSKVGP